MLVSRKKCPPYAKASEGMLELYQFEECPYCQKVRAKLTDLGLTYVIHNVSRDKSDRDKLAQITGGLTGVPALVDPNTDTVIADDDEKIIEYLKEHYG